MEWITLVVCYYTTWFLVTSGWNKILSDSFNLININQAHSTFWFERRHQRLWPVLGRLFGSWRFPEFSTNRRKNPASHAQILASPTSRGAVKSWIPTRYFFLIPAPYFGQIPDPENTLPDPVPPLSYFLLLFQHYLPPDSSNSGISIKICNTLVRFSVFLIGKLETWIPIKRNLMASPSLGCFFSSPVWP